MAEKKKKPVVEETSVIEETTVSEESSKASKYNKRRWFSPQKRAAGYAADLKARVHTYGKKEDQPLTDKEACLRIGYLQAQNDNAGMHIFTKAIKEGKDVKEARRLSRIKGKKKSKKGE